MAVRNIVKIDEEKCNGCGLCVNACAEGAIRIVDGKARLISEVYCDGLGACIGHCPEDAITVETREAAEFDEEATKKHLAEQQQARTQADFVCPGLMAQQLENNADAPDERPAQAVQSQLRHWPVQLKLLSPNAPCFQNADLLLVADCVPFAMGNFHSMLLKDHSVAVGCPKLDNAEFYIEKLAEILKANKLKSLTVVHMEVPCCFGLTHIAGEAVARSGVKMSFEDVTIDLHGNIRKIEKMNSQELMF
ncbi:MAG: ATP-binding protein [Planctomycetota bacterium]|jgi:NAD-dependent dihydropyrimidine dehydrogenase PreA subunit